MHLNLEHFSYQNVLHTESWCYPESAWYPDAMIQWVAEAVDIDNQLLKIPDEWSKNNSYSGTSTPHQNEQNVTEVLWWANHLPVFSGVRFLAVRASKCS